MVRPSLISACRVRVPSSGWLHNNALSSAGSHGSSQLKFSVSGICIPSSGYVFEHLVPLVSRSQREQVS